MGVLARARREAESRLSLALALFAPYEARERFPSTFRVQVGIRRKDLLT
jgi:hypothetical protein